MNVRQSKQIARAWVEAYAARHPGLKGAHLVGSITTLTDDLDYPDYKDVDLHLIFEPGHPALENHGPFMNIIETEYEGVILEVGLKPVTDYQSVEAVVSNPEIAHHLTVDSLLYDPNGFLEALQPSIKAEFPRCRWVMARMDYERRGLDQVNGYFQMVKSMGMPETMKAGLIGYSFTFLTSLMCVVTLRPPTSGSRMLLHLQAILSEYGRLDLYREAIAILGLAKIEPGQVETLQQEGAEAFDLAVKVKRTPNPFQHKLHPHQRRYFIGACQSLLAEKRTVEAAFWMMPFYFSTIEVILADGEEADKPKYLQRQNHFLKILGLETEEARLERFERLGLLRENLFDLANQIVATHPGIKD